MMMEKKEMMMKGKMKGSGKSCKKK